MELYVTISKGLQKAWAYYSIFKVLDVSQGYRLNVGGYNNVSTAGDSLTVHHGSLFTTPDDDNDRNPYLNCSIEHKSPFWHNYCGDATPLGTLGSTNYMKGINWKSYSS